MFEVRGALPEEDGNQFREFRSTHEEKILSSWLRQDVEGEKAEMKRLNEKAKQEESKSGKREVEREGEKMGDQKKVLESGV